MLNKVKLGYNTLNAIPFHLQGMTVYTLVYTIFLAILISC